MAGNFKLDSGFEKAIMRSAFVETVVRQETEAAAAHVRRATRHDSIRKGIIVVVGDSEGRVVGRIVATDFKSHWFEFGTIKMRAEPFLSVGVMAAGYAIHSTGGKR